MIIGSIIIIHTLRNVVNYPAPNTIFAIYHYETPNPLSNSLQLYFKFDSLTKLMKIFTDTIIYIFKKII